MRKCLAGELSLTKIFPCANFCWSPQMATVSIFFSYPRTLRCYVLHVISLTWSKHMVDTWLLLRTSSAFIYIEFLVKPSCFCTAVGHHSPHIALIFNITLMLHWKCISSLTLTKLLMLPKHKQLCEIPPLLLMKFFLKNLNTITDQVSRATCICLWSLPLLLQYCTVQCSKDVESQNEIQT